MRVSGGGRVQLVDGLAMLPLPTDDRARLRVWPGGVDRGQVRWEPISDGVWRFQTILPRRWGEVGAVGGALFADGRWYPEIQGGGTEPTVYEWEVRLRLPEGAVGVLGDVAGGGELRWSGVADRVSLAAYPRGVVTSVAEDGLNAQIVGRRVPRRLAAALSTTLPAARPPSVPSWEGTVAIAPLRTRLAVAGVGVAYVSDRAFRVSPPLRRFHRRPVVRAVAEAWDPSPRPALRSLVGASIAARWARVHGGVDAKMALGWADFLPHVESLRYDGRLPFYDDLVAGVAGGAVSDAIIGQWAALEGPEAPDRLWSSPRGAAAAAAAMPVPWLGPVPPPHDLSLSVDRAAGLATVTRDAMPGPAEVVVVALGSDRVAKRLAPGEVWSMSLAGATSAQVDPDGLLPLADRAGDRWPARWSGTVSGWWSGLDPAERTLTAGAFASARPADDTHLRLLFSAWTDRRSLPGAEIAAAWSFGPPVDGLRRAQRVTASAGVERYDPRFAPSSGLGGGAWVAGLRWRLDTREDALFPLHGAFASASADWSLGWGGGAWGVADARIGALLPASSRVVVAGQLSAAGTFGGGESPLTLGGDDALRSVPSDAAPGDQRAVARVEGRWAPVRGASVPLGLVWLTEWQLTGGVEAGLSSDEGATVGVVGATAGTAVVGDWFGVDPSMLGVTAGYPVASRSGAGPVPSSVQWSVRVGQAF